MTYMQCNNCLTKLVAAGTANDADPQFAKCADCNGKTPCQHCPGEESKCIYKPKPEGWMGIKCLLALRLLRDFLSYGHSNNWGTSDTERKAHEYHDALLHWLSLNDIPHGEGNH
jgi:hypothetical protein